MNHILLRTYDSCQRRKAALVRNRRKGLLSIAVDTDELAIEWQRFDRIGQKCYCRLVAKLAATEALGEALKDTLLAKLTAEAKLATAEALAEALKDVLELAKQVPALQPGGWEADTIEAGYAALRQYREASK